MDNLLKTLRNLGPVRLAAMGIVALGLIGFFVYLTTRLSTPDLAVLYGGLDKSDAGAIVAKLDALQVPYQVSPDGTKISVPADQTGKLRATLALDGLPGGKSTIGMEIFDKPEGFGTTSFIQDINRLRALEGELGRTIGFIRGVKEARVQLVLPKREMFARTTQTATASVFLKLAGLVKPSREQIAAIQHLVASAVPQLDPSRVAIIDDKGAMLASGAAADSPDQMLATADYKRQSYEQNLTTKIENLLGQTVGYGKVRAQVTADLDFDRVVTDSKIVDPDSVVPLSTQTVEDSSSSTERDGLDSVTVANNLPTANDAGSANPLSRTTHSRTESTTNNTMTTTTRQMVREPGQLRRLSVAVVVDGTYKQDAKGDVQYVPRTPDEMKQINSLVQHLVGYDAARGDTIDVENMRFVTPESAFPNEGSTTILGMQREDLFRIAEMAVLAIVAVLVILLVIRPLMARAFERSQEAAAEDEVERLLTDQTAGQAQLMGPGALAQDLALEEAAMGEELEQMIDINRVEGRVRASSLRKVGEIVEKHPEEAVSIIRNWLYQET